MWTYPVRPLHSIPFVGGGRVDVLVVNDFPAQFLEYLVNRLFCSNGPYAQHGTPVVRHDQLFARFLNLPENLEHVGLEPAF